MRQALPPLIEALLDPRHAIPIRRPGSNSSRRTPPGCCWRASLPTRSRSRSSCPFSTTARSKSGGSVARLNCVSTAALRRSSISRWCPSSAHRMTRRSTAPAPHRVCSEMHRFAEAGRLDHLCARGQLQWRQVSDLAATVATFHDGASIAALPTRFGEPAQVLAPALENFDELPALLPGTAEQRRLARWPHGRAANSTAWRRASQPARQRVAYASVTATCTSATWC
jgi:hypothetical protein